MVSDSNKNTYLIKEYINEEELLYQKEFCDTKYKYLLKILTLRLNKIHKLDEKKEFWDKVLGQFLYFHIFQCARFYFSKSFLKKISNMNSPKYFAVPNNCHEYRNLIQNNKLGQDMIYYFCKNFFTKKYTKKKNNFKILKKKNNFYYLTFIKCFIQNFFYILIKPKILISECYWPKKYKFLVLLKSFFQIQVLDFSTSNLLDKKVDFFTRKIMAKKDSNDSFVDFFLSTLFYFFPMSILENFLERKTYTTSFLKKNKNLKYIVNESLDEDNLLLFSCGDKYKIKKVYSEHNFLQYFFLCNNLDRILSKIDIFLSLGWKKSYISFSKFKVTFIRAGSLFPFNIKGCSKSIDCLFLPAPAEIIPFYPSGSYGHCGYKFSNIYTNNTLNFLKNLDKDFIRTISYKPYNKNFRAKTHNYNLEQLKTENWLIHNSAKVLDSTLDGNELIANAKFIITDYLSTSYLQGIRSNIPTIVIHPDTYFFNNRNLSIFKDFYKLNIFHNNYLSASSFVNRIYKNPNLWWHSLEVQKVINNFLNNNLLNEKKYLNSLLNLLRK
jgi:putative transferase (TIGR04331 family)